ncbi:hypothetical protein ACFQY4_46130 [Catellatospora bangladeshensis]|uniref:hypothetical protein n=1 Tax=Catellatospora bangladeshensis TaxID=310355 RepID=UPI00361EFE2A
MPVQAIASAPADEPGAAWLTTDHPLAGVAARRCVGHVHLDPADLLGGVACGSAWATALTDDLLFAVECGLPSTSSRTRPTSTRSRYAAQCAVSGWS